MKRNRRSMLKHAVSVGHEGERWFLDNDNWDRLKKLFPRRGLKDLSIIALEDSTKFFPVHEIVKKIYDTDIIVTFVDSLYSPVNPVTDFSRLRLLLAADNVVIKKFYGYLNAEGIALLPPTIKELCLAIGSLSDAEAVSSIQPWMWLQEMRVCVAPGVAVADLRPLPYVVQRGIFFPFLTDERVPYIVPAIAALLPERRLATLYFPKSRLTAAGALHLVDTLLAMDKLVVQLSITIEPCGTWIPDQAEKEKFKKLLTPKMIIPGVMWSMAWLYGQWSVDCHYQ